MTHDIDSFEAYKGRWRNLALTREDGVLQMSLHTDGGPLLWGAREGSVHDQLGRALRAIARDRGNRVLLLTGSGAAFCAGMNMQELPPPEETDAWVRLMREGQELLMSLVDLEIPVIAAVNGPALIHAELAAMSDIVLASDSAVFADVAHILGSVVPGDGAHVIWPMLLGPNRGRYFLLTGQHIAAREALALGVVSEVLPPDALLPRARVLARQLAPASGHVTLQPHRADATLQACSARWPGPRPGTRRPGAGRHDTLSSAAAAPLSARARRAAGSACR